MATEEGATPTTTDENTNPGTETPPTPESPTEGESGSERVPGEEALGDPGKKALDSMKTERNTARQEAKAAKERIAELEQQLAGNNQEYPNVNEQITDLTSRLSDTQSRLIDAEVRAAAAGRFADAGDVLKFLNADDIVTDGAPDVEKITAELDKLAESKPYLVSAKDENKWGSADAGARKAPQVEMLNADDIRRLHREGKHAEIAAAQREGRVKITD